MRLDSPAKPPSLTAKRRRSRKKPGDNLIMVVLVGVVLSFFVGVEVFSARGPAPVSYYEE